MNPGGFGGGGSDFNQNLNFLDELLKNPQISNLMELRSEGSKLFHADGRTDGHDEATMLFSFTDAPKKLFFPTVHYGACFTAWYEMQSLGILTYCMEQSPS